MTFKEDIAKRIQTDFGEKSDQVYVILKEAIEKADYLNTERVIRCIIFLSKGNVDNLNKYIVSAIWDTRDVMLWAEYEQLRGELNYKRVRDFNNTFDESTKDVKE